MGNPALQCKAQPMSQSEYILPQDIAPQLAQTPEPHAQPTAEVHCEDASSEEASGPGDARPGDGVAGQGMPQGFSSAVCHAGSPAGQPLHLQLHLCSNDILTHAAEHE